MTQIVFIPLNNLNHVISTWKKERIYQPSSSDWNIRGRRPTWNLLFKRVLEG